MTEEEARATAQGLLDGGPSRNLVILDQATLRKPYGWVFFYQARKFVETGDYRFALVGNAPVVVMLDGQIIRIPVPMLDETLAELDRKYGG